MIHWGDRAYDLVNVLLTPVCISISHSVQETVYDHLARPLYNQLRQAETLKEAHLQFFTESR